MPMCNHFPGSLKNVGNSFHIDTTDCLEKVTFNCYANFKCYIYNASLNQERNTVLAMHTVGHIDTNIPK
jgi:hypothetical protein